LAPAYPSLHSKRTKGARQAKQNCARNTAEAKRIQKYKLRGYKFIQINDHSHNSVRINRHAIGNRITRTTPREQTAAQSATGSPAQPRARKPPHICRLG